MNFEVKHGLDLSKMMQMSLKVCVISGRASCSPVFLALRRRFTLRNDFSETN